MRQIPPEQSLIAPRAFSAANRVKWSRRNRGVHRRSQTCSSRLPRHAARRQLYVPLDILRHYGADPEDVFAMRATPELRAVLAEFVCVHAGALKASCAVEYSGDNITGFLVVSAAASMASRYGEARLRPVSASTSGAVAAAVAHLACGEIIPQHWDLADHSAAAAGRSPAIQ